jgi:5-methyltetrahydropteroyltriglutamate--homocysteine methyltransferase
MKFKAHVVGSMLRPEGLADQLREYRAGRIDAAAFKAAEDAAVDLALRIQTETGIELVTDGEQRRLAFGDVLSRSVEGIESVEPAPVGTGGMWRGQQGSTGLVEIDSPTGGVIASKLKRRDSQALEEFVYARAVTRKPVKVTLPSPTMFMASWSPARSTPAYPDLGAALDDVVEILRAEVHALAKAGCRHVQFDAPEATFAIDPESSPALKASGVGRERFCDEVARRLQEVAVEPGVTFSVHVCRGNARGHWHSAGGYDPIAPLLFPRLDRFSYVLLEYDSDRAGGFEALRHLPETACAVLGLVSTKSGVLEDRGRLAQRIDEAARHFPREQLGISPQCGFASDAGGNPITFEQQQAKLQLVGDTARDALGG